MEDGLGPGQSQKLAEVQYTTSPRLQLHDAVVLRMITFHPRACCQYVRSRCGSSMVMTHLSPVATVA